LDRNIICAPSIVSAARPRRGRHVLCRSRPRDRAGDVHLPQDVRLRGGAREISARLVVAEMTSNGGPHRGSGRRRSARRVDLDPATLPVMADFARAWSPVLPAAVAKARRTATAAGVATHRYLGPKLSRLSGRLLNGWALVRIQPVPRCLPTQPAP